MRHRLWRVRYDDDSVSEPQGRFPVLSMRHHIETAITDENWDLIEEWESWSGNTNNKKADANDV